MLILVSPAKTLDYESELDVKDPDKTTTAIFLGIFAQTVGKAR